MEGTGGYSAGNLIFEIQATGKQATKTFNSINASLKMSTFSISKMINKLYFFRNYTKQMFRSLGNIVKLGTDYTETLNLWQVAMRGNQEQAEDFVETMNKAYGISTKTLMNYQAIFKNMLSSLGGISGDVSYQLSEFLTQMALDYASLYNTSIEKAMTTFQSVLSGQVRPIRSIAGYDITETTIFQLYQQLGGTKTMRQLTQTEKRLLRIYAVFQQMESSGAVGDLAKTIGSTSNQFRIFTESTKELGAWLGIIAESYIRPLMPYLNAIVITATNIVKAIAQMKGIKPQEFGIVESVEQLNEELDKTSGKLLSFDRFESLNSNDTGSNLLGIDENLLAGLSQYSSILSDVSGEAQKLAEEWGKFLFTFDESGNIIGLSDKLIEIGNTIKNILITVGGLIGLRLIDKIFKFGVRLFELRKSLDLLNGVIKFGIVLSLYKMIEAFNDGNTTMGTVYAFIMGSMIVAYTLLHFQKLKAAKASLTEAGAMAIHSTAMQKLTLQISMQLDAILLKLGASAKELDMIYALSNAENQNTLARRSSTIAIKQQASAWQIARKSIMGFSLGLMAGLTILSIVPENMRQTASIIMIVVGAVIALTAAIVAMNTAMSWGTALPIMLAGIGAGVAGVMGLTGTLNNLPSSMQAFKNGGQVEDGMFTMSKGEIIGNFDDGSTIVANNMQISAGIENASYRGITRGLREMNIGGGDVYLDGRKVGQTTAKYSHRENVRTGLVKATA